MIQLLVSLVAGTTVVICSSLLFADRLLKLDAEEMREFAKREEEETKAIAEREKTKRRRDEKFTFYKEHPEAVKAERAAIVERRRILERQRDLAISGEFVVKDSKTPYWHKIDNELSALAKEEAEIPLP